LGINQGLTSIYRGFMSSKNILFISPSAYSLGGIPKWLYDLNIHLHKSGQWNTKVALPDGNQHRIEPYIKIYPNLSIVPFCNATGSVEGRRSTLSTLILDQDPDLIVGIGMADIYPAIRRSRLNGFRGKIVMTIHAIGADLIADADAESDLLDAVIATNKLTCRLLEQKTNLPNNRIFYAPYGVKFPQQEVTRKACSPSHPDALRIAWVGRLDESQKRVSDLPIILRLLDAINVKYELTIAGDGPERERLSRSLAQWLNSKVCTITGSLSSSKLQRDVYTTHDVLLITSSWETGPIVAWEAMAAGLAVASSEYLGSGLEGALVNGQNALLFPVGDAVAAANALVRLLDPELRQRIARNGRKLVEARFTEQISHKTWCLAFDQVLQLPHRTSIKPEQLPRPAGRIDRLIGVKMAEKVRRGLGLSFAHVEPGDEWPHTSHGQANQDDLFKLASDLDCHA
jgi:glycosyltransferase involved in cell wall biosynthesis